MDYSLLKDNVVVGHVATCDPSYEPPEGLTLGPPGGPEGYVWDGELYRPPSFSQTRSGYYALLPNAFSPHECDAITAMGLELAMANATVVPAIGGGALTDRSIRQYMPEQRRSAIGWFRSADRGETAWVFDKIWSLASERNEGYFDLSLTHVPDLQFTKYVATAQGHFEWHTDALLIVGGMERKLSFVLALSQPRKDYEGGVFELAEVGALELPRGTVLMFPSPTLHRVTPVTAGERYSLVTWVQGPA